MRTDAHGKMPANSGLHLAHKAKQVLQGFRNLGSSRWTCPLCSNLTVPLNVLYRYKGSLFFSMSYLE